MTLEAVQHRQWQLTCELCGRTAVVSEGAFQRWRMELNLHNNGWVPVHIVLCPDCIAARTGHNESPNAQAVGENVWRRICNRCRTTVLVRSGETKGWALVGHDEHHCPDCHAAHQEFLAGSSPEQTP